MFFLRRFLAGFPLAMLLVFSAAFMPLTLYAAQVTKIHSGAQLLDSAGHYDDGDVFLLAGDIDLTESLVFSGTGSIRLDLGGHRLSVTTLEGDCIALEGAGQTLTITDSGGGGVLSAQSFYEGDKPSYRGSAGINIFGSDQLLIIDGAVINALGGNYGAGIQTSGEKTEILVKGGEVTAYGGLYGAGIGGGFEDTTGKIFIENGSVTAGGGSFAAGIGTGGFNELPAGTSETSGLISISGGRVITAGGSFGAGIGGGQLQNASVISISGGNVSSTGGISAAGIGSGKFNIVGISYDGSQSVNGNISITGGNVKAVGGDFGAGIGTGEGASDLSSEKILDGRKISITGGNVVAIGGVAGAGVGGGAYLSGGEIELDNHMTLDSTGGRQAAGIGGGKGGVAGKNISIASGNIHAFAGDEGAGIGSGSFSLEHLEPTDPYYQQRKNISITGGSITATAHEMAAAIGGGAGGSGANVKISGSPKINASNTWEISIGAGKFSYDNGSIIIDGGNIRSSGTLGIQPKNSAGEPVYRGTFLVCSEDGSKPVDDAPIDILLSDSHLFTVNTSVDGKAVVYMPENIAPMDLRVGKGRYGFGDGSDLKFSCNDETNKTFAISNEIPLKILSRDAVYYVNQKTDIIPLNYEGGIKELLSFRLLNNDCNMQIDPLTGAMKIPINIKPGVHNFTVNAYENSVLVDSADFALTVKNPLIELIPSEKDTEISTNETRFFSFSTYPADADIVETSWRVTTENDMNCEITDMFGESNEKKAMFKASAPGLYQITVAAKDSDSNTISETITVNVSDKSTEPAVIESPGSAPASPEMPVVMPMSMPMQSTIISTLTSDLAQDTIISAPAIDKWSAERIDSSTAKIYIESNSDGMYKYELIPEGQLSNGIFYQGSPISLGKNSITIAGLADAGTYECLIKLADASGLESNIRSIVIPSYAPADILPPQLSGVTLQRLSDSEAMLVFDSDKDGKLYYAIYDEPNEPHGLTWFDFQETSPLLGGKNKVTISSIDKSSERILYVIAEDENLNRSKPLEFVIPAHGEPLAVSEAVIDEPLAVSEAALDKPLAVSEAAIDGSTPVLTAGTALRSSPSSATVSIHTLSYGEYYCAIVPENSPAPRLDVTKGAYAVSPGKNTVSIADLVPGLSYDAYILYKDESGRTSNSVRVSIPA